MTPTADNSFRVINKNQWPTGKGLDFQNRGPTLNEYLELLRT